MGPVKKLNCLNNSGPTKVVKILSYIRTKTSLVGPVKKLNFLATKKKTSLMGPFKKLFLITKSTKSTKCKDATKQKHKTQIGE